MRDIGDEFGLELLGLDTFCDVFDEALRVRALAFLVEDAAREL